MAKTFNISFKFNLTDNMTVPLKGLSTSMAGLARTSGAASASMTRMSSGTGSIFKGIIGAQLFTRALSGLASTIKESIGLASDLTEVQNVVDTTFGTSAAQINKWSKEAITNFGLSELQAKKYTGTLGAMLKSSGLSGDAIVKLSTDLIGLVGDFASFYNLDHEMAMTKIRSGISGETEPLKQLGVNMSVANLEAFALTQGISKQFSKMKQSEQVMLRYNYLMKVSKDAQGDFAKTLSTSYANQKRVNDTLAKQKLAAIFVKVLPMLIEAYKSINSLISSIDADYVGDVLASAFSVLGKAIKFAWMVLKPFLLTIISTIKWLYSIKTAIMLFVAALLIYKGTMLAIIAIQWIQYLKMMWPLIKSVTASQWAWNIALTANPIGILVVALAAAVGWIVYLNYNIQKMNNLFMELTTILDNPIFAALFSAIPGMDNMIRLRTMNKEAMEAKAASKGALGKSETDIKLKVTAEGGAQVKTESVKKKGGQKVELNTNNGSILGWG
jgi:hypothetical protein